MARGVPPEELGDLREVPWRDDALQGTGTRADIPADIAYLRSVLPSTTEDAFFDYLSTVDASEVTVTSVPEGSIVFSRVRHMAERPHVPISGVCGCGDVTVLSPQVPLLQVKGPLLVVQLLETTLLCLVSYAR